MGLEPGTNNRYMSNVLDESFNGGSPYFDMFRAGWAGIPIEDCISKCTRNGIALRQKDIANYEAGFFKRNTGESYGRHRFVVEHGMPFDDMKLENFPKMPVGWNGTERRFFPCTIDNRPMQQWGWKRKEDGSLFEPELYSMADAKALSPCGWIGQNMLYQKFVVMDIDGRGHGVDDIEVIRFGTQFKEMTLTMEDPAKPGSFHLYFATDRLIPVKHFPWAKLDFMGNAGNYAVYFKNKRSNGLPMMELDEETWQKMMEYQKRRKESICHLSQEEQSAAGTSAIPTSLDSAWSSRAL
jgi:hypothetical protein